MGQITKGTNNGSIDGALVLSAGCVCRKVDRVVSREGGISLAISLSMVSLLVVRVLVLSEHRIVTPASSSMALIWVARALNRTHRICHVHCVRHIC